MSGEPLQEFEKPLTNPAYYSLLYNMLVPFARSLGYALTIHGSLQRDLDLVAIPWTDEAIDETEFVHKIVNHLGGADCDPNTNPINKPHGRKAWTINLTGHMYIDLSVTPKEYQC